MVGLTLEAIKPPLASGPDEVIRIGGTRVTFDSVVEAFGSGATAEEIALQFPSLSLADVYTAISFFLNHQDEVEQYLHGRRAQRNKIRAANESKFAPVGIRQRLLGRRGRREL